jgi:lysophospholipase L1-like esterase
MTPSRLFRSTFFFAILIVFAGAAAAQTAVTSGDQHWVATWGAAQTPARISLPGAARGAQPAPATPTPQSPPAAPAIPIAPQVAPPQPDVVQRRYNLPPAVSNFNNQTVRMILRTSIGGQTLRIRLFNAVGAPTVTLGAAHVALHAKDSAIVPGSDRALTFSGLPSATMYAGEVLISDPVKLNVAPLSDLAVSLYFPDATGAPTNHPLGLRPTYTSAAGDFTAASEISDPSSITEAYYWLEGVDVLAPADAAAIVTFGDSITDGDQSTPGLDAMWPAVVAERLQADKSTVHIAVVNEGISGNRILGDNVSGLSRFAHQALDVPGVRWITVLEGINDINAAMRALSAPAGSNGETTTAAPKPFSAENLITAYRQMIDAAHSRGVNIIGCTLTPYGGSSNYKDPGEAIREAANDWIRTPGHFDAVIDFDAATRGSADPKRFSLNAESPDLLHPGDAGYKMMANAIRLSLFTPSATAAATKH